VDAVKLNVVAEVEFNVAVQSPVVAVVEEIYKKFWLAGASLLLQPHIMPL